MKREADGDMGAPFKRSRRGDEEVRILIPRKVAGAIIGKGGQNISKLRSQYKASITVPDCPGPERMLNLSSDLDTICNIVSDVIPNLEENGGRINADELDLRMMIHQSQAGCVIGRGGTKIKEMRDKTGARIKIFSNCAPQSTDRVIQIMGQPPKCIEAIREILALIRGNPIKGPVNPYDPHNFDDFYAEEYGGFGSGQGGENRRGPGGGGPPPRPGGRGNDRDGGGGGGGGGGRYNNRGPPTRSTPMGTFSAPHTPRGGNNYGGGSSRGMNGATPTPFDRQSPWGNPMNHPPPHSNLVPAPVGGSGPNAPSDNLPPHQSNGGGGVGGRSTTQVTIPKDLAGAIIGKGGMRIRKIRMDSGAGITIDDPLLGSNDRVITITGTSHQIQMAQYLLQQSVHNNSDRTY